MRSVGKRVKQPQNALRCTAGVQAQAGSKRSARLNVGRGNRRPARVRPSETARAVWLPPRRPVSVFLGASAHRNAGGEVARNRGMKSLDARVAERLKATRGVRRRFPPTGNVRRFESCRARRFNQTCCADTR